MNRIYSAMMSNFWNVKATESIEIAVSSLLCIYLGNTRVITQNNLQKFQKEVGNVIKDPYQVVLKSSKLPLSLLHDRAKVISLFYVTLLLSVECVC